MPDSPKGRQRPGAVPRIRSMEKTNEGNDMSALWTALMEGETKESLATMVCELRGQKQAGQAASRSEVLEVAAKIADEFADMFRTEPPPSDNFWAGALIAKAIRDLKDASAPKIGGTLDDPPLAPAGRARDDGIITHKSRKGQPSQEASLLTVWDNLWGVS